MRRGVWAFKLSYIQQTGTFMTSKFAVYCGLKRSYMKKDRHTQVKTKEGKEEMVSARLGPVSEVQNGSLGQNL